MAQWQGILRAFDLPERLDSALGMSYVIRYDHMSDDCGFMAGTLFGTIRSIMRQPLCAYLSMEISNHSLCAPAPMVQSLHLFAGRKAELVRDGGEGAGIPPGPWVIPCEFSLLTNDRSSSWPELNWALKQANLDVSAQDILGRSVVFRYRDATMLDDGLPAEIATHVTAVCIDLINKKLLFEIDGQRLTPGGYNIQYLQHVMANSWNVITTDGVEESGELAVLLK